MMEEWEREFSFQGKTYFATFRKRPFREGVEVTVEFEGELIRLAELGYGEKSTIERLTSEMSKIAAAKSEKA